MSVELISSVVDKWLRDEVEDSKENRNRVLDAYENERIAFAAPVEVVAREDPRKLSGHYTRYKQLLRSLDERALRDDDFVVGRLIHHSLMFVSGGFRNQCFLAAGSQKEYETLRFGRLDQRNGASGVPLDRIVGELMSNGFSEEPDLDDYFKLNLDINEAIYDSHCQIHRWFQEHPDRAKDRVGADEFPIEATLLRQEAGINLAVGNIVVAVALRDGELARVPFLEAKGISDVSPNPHYPFAA